MEFLKKNYEKVILSFVLLVLMGAAVWLFLRVTSEKTELETIQNMDERMVKSDLAALNLSTNEAYLRRLRRPEPVRLTREHNLFNPVVWQKRPDGSLVKVVTGNEVGAGALTVTNMRPLRLIVSYDGSSASVSGAEANHRFKITREAHRDPRKRSTVTLSFGGVGSKADAFVLRDMKPKDNPQEFSIELTEERRQITVGAQKPYEGTNGWLADLRYEPERLSFIGKRVEDRLFFAGDTNRIVSVEADSVTVEAQSNKKRTTIFYRPGAAAPSKAGE